MKTIYNAIKILVFAVLPFIVACNKDLLEKPVQGALNESILTSREGINALLIGAMQRSTAYRKERMRLQEVLPGQHRQAISYKEVLQEVRRIKVQAADRKYR